MADLTQFAVPYPVLLAEYQERVHTLTDEVIMLRASIAYLQRTTPPVPPPSAPEAQQLPDAPPGEPEN